MELICTLILNTLIFLKWNLLVLNFAHHLPIVANNSQSSDYGLCHNYTAEVQQVIFVQTKLLWKAVILKMIIKSILSARELSQQ